MKHCCVRPRIVGLELCNCQITDFKMQISIDDYTFKDRKRTNRITVTYISPSQYNPGYGLRKARTHGHNENNPLNLLHINLVTNCIDLCSPISSISYARRTKFHVGGEKAVRNITVNPHEKLISALNFTNSQRMT